MTRKTLQILMVGLTVWLQTNTVGAQLSSPSVLPNTGYPDYPVSYVVPSVNNVREVVDRMYSRTVNRTVFNVYNKNTAQPISDFSKPDKDAYIPDSMGELIGWTYPNGVILSACHAMSVATNDPHYSDYAVKFFDFTFKAMPFFREMKEKKIIKKHLYEKMVNMRALDHCGSISCALIKTEKMHHDPLYRNWIDTVANYISNKQFRLNDGTIARERPQPESLWADDFYMCIPFLAQLGTLTGDTRYYDDAVKQVILLSARLFDKESGLYDHGWNENSSEYDPHFHWARANGWCTMAMAELLSVLPVDYKGRDQVLHIYRSHLKAIAELQDGTGLWHNLLDRSETFLETSASAMFVYSIAKGINEGWISHVYGPVAVTGWNALTTKVSPEGKVCDIVVGTTFAHDNTYYFNRGTSCETTFYGPVMYAGSEIIRLLNNPRLEIIAPAPNSMNSAMHFRLKGDKPMR